MFDATDVRGWIVDALENNAEWRSRKAEEYPDDERNQDAVAESLKLRDEVFALPDAAFAALVRLANAGDDGMYRLCERQSEEIKAIGFRSFPRSGEELVKSLARIIHESEL